MTHLTEKVHIRDESAEACLAVFESIDILKHCSVATELRRALAEFDERVGQCPGGCHGDYDGGSECARCDSGRGMQMCDDCRSYAS